MNREDQKEMDLENKGNFGIPVKVLKEIVNKWLQREHGSDDIDYVEDNGGDQWLKTGLRTNFELGIDESSVQERRSFYGSNEKEKVRIKGFWELSWEALDDLILRILILDP